MVVCEAMPVGVAYQRARRGLLAVGSGGIAASGLLRIRALTTDQRHGQTGSPPRVASAKRRMRQRKPAGAARRRRARA
jgi:hypothetical protein